MYRRKTVHFLLHKNTQQAVFYYSKIQQLNFLMPIYQRVNYIHVVKHVSIHISIEINVVKLNFKKIKNKKNILKQLILATIFFAFGILGYANHPLVRNFQRETYKAGTQNWSIAQDDQNSMYFANNNGLLLFDGRKWTTVPIKNRTNVRSLLYTKDERFYASTFNEFGYFIKQKNQFVYHSLSEKLNLNKQESNALFSIIEGNKIIYFQGEKNIYEYDGSKIEKISFHSKIDASAYINNVLFFTSEQSGGFMLNGKQAVRLPGSEILINKKVCSILKLDSENILFITNFDGVYLFDGNTFAPYATGIDNFLKANQVFCAAKKNTTLAFGTVQNGLAILNLSDKTVTYVNTFTGLQNNTVLSMAFDNQMNLWLGLDKGIDYVILNTPIQNVLGINNLYGSGYTSYLKNNTLYFGTNQGLYTCSYPLTTNTTPTPLTLIKGMEGQVWSLNEIENTLFCGNDHGASIISSNRAEKIEGLNGTWGFRQLKKHPNIILGCSYKGLFSLKKTGNQWKYNGLIKGKFTESSPVFEEDKNGTVWFSHWQKGIFHLYFNAAMDSITRVDVYNQKNGLPSDLNNTLFQVGNEILFSTLKGFYVFNNRTRRMEPNTKWNNLFNTVPSDMRLHETKAGDVWCVSGRFIGLAKKMANNSYKIDSLTYRILQSKILIGFENFYSINPDNQIIGTEDGFSWVNIKSQYESKDIFKVFLKSVYVTNMNSQAIFSNQYSTPSQTPVEYSHQENSLTFEFIAPEYRIDDAIQYSYMLVNYDKTWSQYSSNNSKEYTKLPKGNYVFKIKAHNLLSSKDSFNSYAFSILPAWYETKLAYSLYFIFLIAGITLLVIGVNKQSKKASLEMEKQKELELNEQKKFFETETMKKKREIKELKNQQLHYELRHKSQELASSTMNLIRKNEMMLEIMDSIEKATMEIKSNVDSNLIINRLSKMERNIKQNIENDNNWKRFEENFDLVYENYLKRLSEMYPDLNTSDKKLCAYLKMDLSSKDISPLLNMSIRSVETNRYRLRKKLNLDRDINLSDFLQKF